MAFPFMDYYISGALKQKATWQTWKNLEGQSYIVQDSCFHFSSLLLYKGCVTLFISFSKNRAKFKIFDQHLYMSSKALDYDSWKCCCKSSLCLNVVSLCEQVIAFHHYGPIFIMRLLWNKRHMAFPIMDYYISCALKQQATGHQCKVLEGQSSIM